MDLDLVLKKGETPEVEFKEIMPQGDAGNKELAKDISAMANSARSVGLIIYGVSKTKKPVGIVRDDQIIERINQVISDRCSPPVRLNCEWIIYKRKNLLIVRIPPSNNKPHSLDNGRTVFLRRDIIVNKATMYEIHELMQRQRGIGDAQNESENELISEFHVPTYDEEKYQTMFYPLTSPPQAYRTIEVTGPYAEPDTVPIFAPHLGKYSDVPEFGNTRSAIMFEDEFDGVYSLDKIKDFLNTLERKVWDLHYEARAWSIHPMSWGLSQESKFTYGLSSSNAISAIERINYGRFAAMFSFDRVNVYKPACWLVAFLEIRSRENSKFYIRNGGLKLLISSIPINSGWINQLFDATNKLTGHLNSHEVGNDAVMEEVYTLKWRPTEKVLLEPGVIELFGRDKGSESDFDSGLGVSVKTDALKTIKYSLDDEESWHGESYKDVYDNPPIACFEEIPMQITNPVPVWKELQTGKVKIHTPMIKQATISLAGYTVTPISPYSHFVRPDF